MGVRAAALLDGGCEWDLFAAQSVAKEGVFGGGIWIRMEEVTYVNMNTIIGLPSSRCCETKKC